MSARAMRTRTAAAVGAAAIFVSACGGAAETGDFGADGDATGSEAATGDGAATGAVDEACTEDRVGGTITVAAYDDPNSLDPIGPGNVLGAIGGDQLTGLYSSLMRYDVEAGEYEPWLAESLESNDEFDEWTLSLDPAVEFGDGSPMDAEAVIASIERHRADETSSEIATFAGQIESMEAVDATTVQFFLAAPWADFPYLLARGGGWITNPAVVDGTDAEELQLAPPEELGAGPYYVERFAPGDETVLRAKDDWWGGPVCIEEIRFVAGQSGRGQYDAFQQGEFHVMKIPVDVQIANEAQADGVRGVTWSGAHGAYILNHGVGAQGEDAVTTDPRVNQALQLALNLDSLSERIWEGAAFPADDLVHPESPLAPDVSGLGYDPARASDLVQEVKDDTDWDGSIKFVCNRAPLQSELAVQSQAMWEAVGFDVELVEVENPAIVQTVMLEPDYEVACWGLTIDPACVWCSASEYRSDSSQNYNAFGSDDLDAAIDQLQVANNVEDKQAGLGRFQEAWGENPARLSLGHLAVWSGYADELRGVVPNTNSVFIYEQAYLAD